MSFCAYFPPHGVVLPDRPTFICERDLDFDRVIERLEADGFDLSGVITGLCLLVKLAKHRRFLLLDELALAPELNEPYRKPRLLSAELFSFKLFYVRIGMDSLVVKEV